MEVKKGYKQTEVGVIPEEWGSCVIGDVALTSSGTTPSRSLYDRYFKHGSTAWVKTLDLNNSWICATDEQVTERALQETSLRVYPVGTVLIAMYGGFNQIGRTGILNVPAAVNQAITAVQPQATILHSQFLLSMLNFCVDYWKNVASSSLKDPNITSQDVRCFPIAIPPLPEQRAIATALSDVDALLAKLDQLLAKKRDLKQAAMQELLTGKRRLPGFVGEWEERTMTEVCWFQEGPGVRNTQFTTTGIKLLNGTNIFRGVLNLENTSRFISENEAHGPYAHFLADEGDIVLASSGITIERLHEKVAFVRTRDLPFCMNTSTIRFKPSPGVSDPDFLFQFLTSDIFKRQIGGQATGSAQLNFGPSHVGRIDISIPPLLEQTAIAAVLSDMDAEIAALEARREKVRLVKQGMMQELLTGRIRLV